MRPLHDCNLVKRSRYWYLTPARWVGPRNALAVLIAVGMAATMSIAAGGSPLVSPAVANARTTHCYDSPSAATTPPANPRTATRVATPGSEGAQRPSMFLIAGNRATKGADDLPVGVGRGPHAGDSIPARGTARDFTAAEREAIDDIGARTGCHTCGTRSPGTKSGHFVPDHQPPSSLLGGESQRLFPQCIFCSRDQGLAIARMRRQEWGRP